MMEDNSDNENANAISDNENGDTISDNENGDAISDNENCETITERGVVRVRPETFTVTLFPDGDDPYGERKCLQRVTCICCSIWIYFAVLYLIMPVANIMMATLYHDQCPEQPRINTFLYVDGVVCIIEFLILFIMIIPSFCICCCSPELTEKIINIITAFGMVFCVIEVLIHIFLFAWFITGSVWVYDIFEHRKSMDCDYTLYLFTFTALTIRWVLFAIRLIRSFVRCRLCIPED